MARPDLLYRFLESLSAKVHPTPLSIDALSNMFQDFYTRAASQISTHIATLQSRLSRERSSSQSSGTKNSKPLPVPTRKGTGTGTSSPNLEQQMMTASEVNERKKARRQLELKRIALEEAVERLVCEKLYDKLWRHRSTDDEERDHKLRSRIAALSLLGVGLKELLPSNEDITDEIRQTTEDKEETIKLWLEGTRTSILRMDDERNPIGKLQYLVAAYKSIVETLTRLFPGSSSADEILPTLIFALITIPPEKFNVISNMLFIQRFRAQNKQEGEVSYCLVTLEAAISFLETVDLSTLHGHDGSEGPDKHSIPGTPKSETGPMNLGLSQVPNSIQPAGVSPVTTKSQRRLSNLIRAQTDKIEATGDAVRESILASADQAFDSIHNTLDNSFNFLFGRLREQQNNSTNSAGANSENLFPKTLEDARKLVSTPPPLIDDDAASSVADDNISETRESKLADLFGGKRPLRDRSVDSNKSGGSGRRVVFAADNKPGHVPIPVTQPLSTTPPSVTTPLDSVRNFGNALNPLNRFGIPRFGRATTSSTAASVASNTGSVETAEVVKDSKEWKAIATLEELKKTQPPLRRFLECKDAKDLKIGDIDELLKDYQRLAAAMRNAIQN
jgi:hypothetical protein